MSLKVSSCETGLLVVTQRLYTLLEAVGIGYLICHFARTGTNPCFLLNKILWAFSHLINPFSTWCQISVWYSIIIICHIIFNQSPVFEHLSCYQFSVIINNNNIVNILMIHFCFELFFRIFLEECLLGERMYIFIAFDTYCQGP